MLYGSDKFIPYKYNATMLEDDKDLHIPSFSFFVNISDVSGVTQSGRVFAIAAPRRTKDVVIEKPTQAETSVMQTLHSNIVNQSPDQDEMLKLIKKSDFNMVDQLLHTHPRYPYQFDDIMANITAYNNLSFSDEELPEQGRNHNLALHISMNCQEDAMSNVLVEIGSYLNVLPKSTLSKLSYQGAPMRFGEVIVKAFDGSRKTIAGEIDLPMKIGSCLFQITFQVLDIYPIYSCLLGHPWIHEAGAVTSTFHQKLKFVKNEKLVIMGGEQAMLVSHLSSFTYIDADEAEGASFQALFVDNITARKNGESMASLKDAQYMVKNGQSPR